MSTFRELFEKVDQVDIFARELAKCKTKMDDAVYKKMHKLLMANDIKKAEEGLKFLKRYKNISEGKFQVADVMGHEYYIVTDGKEMFSDAGEIQKKPKEHDLWVNNGKKYNDFLMSKKEADDLVKELGNKFKALKVTTNKEK